MYTYGTEWFPLHFRLVIVLLLYCAASEDIWTPVNCRAPAIFKRLIVK